VRPATFRDISEMVVIFYFPIHPPLIKKYQDTDKQLKLLVQRTNGKDFATKKVEDVGLQ
jgi:hypothetical protein